MLEHAPPEWKNHYQFDDDFQNLGKMTIFQEESLCMLSN